MRDPDVESMNWSVVIFSGVLLGSVGYYYSGAKARYIAPVELVKFEEYDEQQIASVYGKKY